MRSKFTRAHQVDILPNATVPTDDILFFLKLENIVFNQREFSTKILS